MSEKVPVASSSPPSTESKWLSTNPTEINPPKWDFASLFSGKNAIIMVLLLLILLSLVGINLLGMVGHLIEAFNRIFIPMITHVLALLGISTGELINTGADVAAQAADLGVDIAKGATHSIGDLLIQSSQSGVNGDEKNNLEKALHSPKPSEHKHGEPAPVQSSEPTVAPISSQKPKAGWCYIGDYAGSRGCVAMDEHNKCMSGQVFPSQSACLYPTANQDQN